MLFAIELDDAKSNVLLKREPFIAVEAVKENRFIIHSRDERMDGRQAGMRGKFASPRAVCRRIAQFHHGARDHRHFDM